MLITQIIELYCFIYFLSELFMDIMVLLCYLIIYFKLVNGHLKKKPKISLNAVLLCLVSYNVSCHVGVCAT